ncbi:biotin--[acetyl-CoA-carboxylase] ligase [Alkalicoccus chagannorensis]|uniref:biotin--[acetyl-CoA-carboxylase] ligase n=1 Tax=Alkalicoccus chagannorensis TaxID=427072 RepID=UPI00040DE62B|nr:biotin--[acetyl-CoA-carboxylase] ligase [Alkalicoccus chagannorensis]
MIKTDLLRLLQQTPGYVSGEAAAAELNCSRTAVWKAVQQLEKEGYEIRAVRRKGYELLTDSGTFSSHGLAAALRHPRRIEHFASIPTTQTKANQLAAEGAGAGTVVSADEQTGGRGRLGRPWATAEGTGLAVSIIERPDIGITEAPAITMAAAVTAAEVLEKHGVHPAIKWPNDLLLEEKKVCGILTEMQSDPDEIRSIVIGIGMNVNETSFPADIPAVSLYQHTGVVWNRTSLTAELLDHWFEQLQLFEREGFAAFKDRWEKRAYRIGMEITIHQPRGDITGTMEGIDETGRLLLRLSDGTLQPVVSGDVPIG